MFDSIPPLLPQFLMTMMFSFIIGLEFHSYLRINHNDYKFGSIRTLVLVGLLGFLLYILDNGAVFFSIGLGVLGVFLAVFYWRQSADKQFSLFEVLVALLVFLIGPVTVYFPAWFLVLLTVSLIMILGEKPLIHQFSNRLANDEIVTLGKFLIISGVILPLLPDKQLAPALPVTFYKAWLAVIVVSGFSYLSYLAQTYFFKTRGLLLTGLLGGLYSSTATSVVVGRRARGMAADRGEVSAAVIMATAMMYVRLLLIIYFLDYRVGKILAAPFGVLIALSCLAAWVLLRLEHKIAPGRRRGPKSAGADHRQPIRLHVRVLRLHHPLRHQHLRRPRLALSVRHRRLYRYRPVYPVAAVRQISSLGHRHRRRRDHRHRQQ